MIQIIRLIRLPNLIIIALTMVLIRYCIIQPLFNIHGFVLIFDTFSFILLIISTVFIAAGGYIINDYFDIKIDIINHPDDKTFGLNIGKKAAMALYFIFTITGIIAGIWVLIKNHLPGLSFFFILIAGLLWFYSTTYKKIFLVGNLIISLLTALVPFTVAFFDIQQLYVTYITFPQVNLLVIKTTSQWVIIYSFFAFISNLVREFIKDAEDFEGDYIDNRKTLPIVTGNKITKLIINILLILIFFSILYVCFFFIKWKPFLVYITVTLLIPLLFLIYLVVHAKNKKAFARASDILKVIIVFGILSALLIRTYLYHHL